MDTGSMRLTHWGPHGFRGCLHIFEKSPPMGARQMNMEKKRVGKPCRSRDVGAAEGNRTPDIQLGKLMLYH